MTSGSPQDFGALLQRFRELWRGDRATLSKAVRKTADQVALISSRDPTKIDWRDEVATLLRGQDFEEERTADRESCEATDIALRLCAITLELGLKPSARKLATLRCLARHSWELEHSLTDVILLAMDEDDETRQAWLELIKAWLPQSSSHPQHSGRQVKAPSWGDIFQPNASHEDVSSLMTPLAILLKVDLQFGLSYLESLGDWELAENALLVSGAASTFEQWCAALAQADLTFGPSGSWTGARLSLLLVKRAQEVILLPAGSQLFGMAASELPWICERVIAEIRRRADGIAMLRCWSVSTFRSYVATGDSWSRSRHHLLAEALSRLKRILDSMPADVRCVRASGDLPAGYPAWFVWYERGLEVHWHVDSAKSRLPTAQVIGLYEQSMRWESAASRDVRDGRAHIGFGMLQFEVGLLDRHMGAALATAHSPATAWSALWQRTFDLRERIEFVGYSDDWAEAWQERGASSGLTEIVLRLGLAAAEAILQSTSSPDEERVVGACALLSHLQQSCIEMATIDLLRADIWSQALRYALLLWGRIRGLPPTNDGSVGSNPDAAETQLLEYLSADPQELLFALLGCANNGISEPVLAKQVNEARIDFSGVVAQARKFSQTDMERRRLPKEAIALACRLCSLVAAS